MVIDRRSDRRPEPGADERTPAGKPHTEQGRRQHDRSGHSLARSHSHAPPTRAPEGEAARRPPSRSVRPPQRPLIRSASPPRAGAPGFTTTEGTETSRAEPTLDVRVGAHTFLHLDGDTSPCANRAPHVGKTASGRRLAPLHGNRTPTRPRTPCVQKTSPSAAGRSLAPLHRPARAPTPRAVARPPYANRAPHVGPTAPSPSAAGRRLAPLHGSLTHTPPRAPCVRKRCNGEHQRSWCDGEDAGIRRRYTAAPPAPTMRSSLKRFSGKPFTAFLFIFSDRT